MGRKKRRMRLGQLSLNLGLRLSPSLHLLSLRGRGARGNGGVVRTCGGILVVVPG